MAGRKSGANVFELANRIAINNNINDTTGVADSLADHQSGSNNDAHQINNISGLQLALNSKANAAHSHIVSDITGLQSMLYSKADKSSVQQVITVITGVNFANQTVTKANINIVDGTITGIN